MYIYNDEDNAPMCESCMEYDKILEACTRDWNILDKSYYIPARDDRKPDDECKDYVKEDN